MSDADRYLERAAQLERIAKESVVPEHNAQLLEIAAEWRRMAAQVERLETRSWTAGSAARSQHA